jgi:hypothetical protein
LRRAHHPERSEGSPHHPKLVGRGYLSYQVSNLAAGFWAHDALSPRNPTPEEAETLAMPGHHGLRFHDDQGLTPILPHHGEAHPEQTIFLSQSGSMAVPLEHRELLTEGQVLQSNIRNIARPNIEGEAVKKLVQT